MTTLLLILTAFALDPNAWLQKLTIGTNTYQNVHLTRRSDEEAIARYDGGTRKVRLSDLPEPLRTAWYDEKSVKEKREQERIAAENKFAAEQEAAIQRSQSEREHLKQKNERDELLPVNTPRIPTESPGSLGMGALFGLVIICLYFLPAGQAYSRKHRNASAIFVLNFFLGWTLIGWVAALVWASTNQQQTQPTP